jgi:hypothetical protein
MLHTFPSRLKTTRKKNHGNVSALIFLIVSMVGIFKEFTSENIAKKKTDFSR